MRVFIRSLIALIAVVGFIVPALAQTGTAKSKSSLQTELNNCFPTQLTGYITPSIALGCFSDMLASWQQYAKVNAQTGTTYTVQTSDYGQLVTFNNSSPVAVSLPAATATGFTPFSFYASDLGSGTATITPASGTIGGSSSLALAQGQWVFIVSDGTNYQIMANSFSSISTSNVLGNFSGGNAIPSAQSVPSCANDGAHALTNNSGSGFNCTSLSSSPPGTYVLSHATGSWVCTAPNGATVSTSGTTTTGIVECNAAAVANSGNFTIRCPAVNGSVFLAASSNITLGAAVITYNFNGCYLVMESGTNLTFDTMPNGASLDWDSGQIFCETNSTNCVHIHPESSVSGVYTFNPTYFSLPYVIASCSSNGVMSSIIDFDTTFGHTISENTAIYAGDYHIGFVDGFDGTHNCAVAGVKAENPTDSFEAFGQNDIYVGYVQGFTTNGIQEGTGAVTQATQSLATNHWRFTIGSSGSPTNGFLSYGFDDRIEGTVSINSGTLTNGLNFAATTANGNWFDIPQLAGSTAITDSSTSIKNYGFYNGTGYKTGGSF